MEKMKLNESWFAIRVLIVALLIVCEAAPAWGWGHGGPHYARVSVTASPSGQGKVYMTTDGDYVPEDGDWQNNMSATWNCNDGVNNEEDSRTYYVHAQPSSGYHFVKWSSNSSGSDSKSTAAKYAYSTSASSESSGSPTANSIYAIFAVNPTYTCTLLTSENGTYKYKYGDTEEVTVASQHSVTTNQNFTFTALPAAGYTLYGWYTKSGGTKTYFDYTSTTISSYALPGNISIGVDFVPVGTPIFQIKGANKTYTDLNAAIAACGAATKTIVLINNGTLPAGNYTIPANVTLLIPFDEGFTCYTTSPSLTTNTFITPEVYRTLTMAPGATLTVNGAVSVSAKLSSRSGYGPNGATSGKYGAIKMLSEGNTKSKITLKSGAKLYGWGYVYGEGAVEALSGSTVYEGFVITDWRGGNNTLDIYNKRTTYKVFPFNQYYIQNIEVPLTIHKGATETVYSSIYGDGDDYPLSITMVGASEGLFRLTGTGAKLTKWYDPLYDRQHYELEGAAAINAISFTAFGMTVSSSEYVLPITNNMDITVRSGATVSIAEDICIMPDASVTVEQGATVNIAKNVYVYDIQANTNAGTYKTNRGGYPSAGPGRYAAGAYVRRISYSPSWAALSDRELRRVQNMSSAHFQVNGTLTVNGKIYTTEGGADIFSTADGAAVNLVTGAGTATKTYQVDHENYDAYYYTIPITSAQLHNADGSYQATAGNAANTTWTYANGHWGWRIIWREEDGTELKRMYQPAQPNATWLSSNAPATSKPDEGTCSYVFNGWNTVTNTSRQEIEVTADYTKTCAEYYDVLWKSEDGTETYETDAHTGKGETTRYNGAAPSKADDKTNGFTYTFDGWTTQPNGGGTKYNIGGTPAATGNITYYAHFTTTEVVATVTANGVVTYYPSIADAFTAANASDYTPTIQVWRDAQNTPALTYTAKNHCTLDLNGHTVSGTNMPLLTINDEGFTFTITDLTETKEGKLAGTSGVSQAFVVRLVSGVFRLEAGTVYGQYTASTAMAGVYAESKQEIIINGGTIQVDANGGTGYGIFAQGKATVNGGTFRVESSAKAAYAVQAQGAKGNVTVTDGRFYAAGSSTGTVTCVIAKGGATLTVNGGYYNTNTNLATYLGAGRHIFNLPSSELPYKYKVGTGGYTVTFRNSDGTVLQSGWWEGGATPEYTGDAPAKPGDTGGGFIHSGWTPELAPVTDDATYTATYIPAPPVASVTISGSTTNYIHFSDAWSAVNSATAASTLTLLLDVTFTAKLTYNNSNNKDCTLNLNGHTLTSNTSQQSPLHISNANVTFTITDGTENKSGKLSLNTSSSSTIFGAYAEKGNLLLNAGTIEVISSTATACGVTINNGTFTMNGGTIHVKTTNNKDGRGIYANSTTTINGGTILVEAGGAGYGIKRDGGTATVVDGKFNISGSTANVTTQASANASVVVRGGYYTTNNQLYPTAPYHVFALTSGAEFDEGYRYKVVEGYTLTWSTDGDALTGDYTSGLIESGATIVAPATPTREGYTFAGWSPAFTGTMPAVNTTYTATWAVASVTISGTITLYTTFLPAWTAANSATAASTLKLLDDVDLTTGLEYTNASKNCTLDLNGHIISGSATPLLKIAQDGITFIITDLSEEKDGRIECNTHISGSKWAVEVTKSTLRFEGGTIYAKNTHAGDLFIGIYSGASGVIEMSGGNIHTVTTAANPAYGVLTFGTATISGDSFKVESGAAGYAVEARNANSNVTITGGHFFAAGSSTACVHTEGSGASLTLQGGYYNTNTNLAANCATNYHVFPNDDATYLYKVAEGYTVTFKNGEETLQSGLWETGSTPVYAGETPAKAATAQYTYTFDGWSPAITAVTTDATYTAQFSSTVNTYTVTWKYADGTTLETDENVPYGATPAYNGATPQKATDAEYAYTFNGWSPAVSAVTGDAVYTATYTKTPVVASVTVNATGYTLYYTDFSKAFTVAREATAAVTITLLRDASSASLQYSGANTDCTLDLNGHTLTCTSTQLILNMNKAGSTFTITDKSESKSGQMRIEATNTSEAYGVYINHGHLKLEAGTIYASLVATTCAGVRAVNANSSFTMDGGTIHVVTTNAKNGIGVTASNGTTVIHGGTIQVEAAADGYGIKRDGGTVTVNGGKFNISATGSAYATNQTSANANVVIRGGYYTTNSRLYPTAPYHVFDLDNQSPYLYEVAEGYTLTWTTDGDPLTGTYTSGVTKPGATIVEPATPTKTGYTFNVWNPAVAETMPAENTEYTATWTPNTNTAYTVTHYQQNIADDEYTLFETENLTGTTDAATEAVAKSYTGFTAQSFSQSTIAPDGSTTVSIYYDRDKFTITWNNADGTTLETDANVKYGALPVYDGATPTKATDAEYAYAFDTWSPAVTAVTGDVTYTATYTTTPVVASVTANSTTAYYTSFADAWTAANSATAASTLTLLQDISGLSSSRTYSASHNLTLNLNGHTLSGSGTSLFQVGCAGYTFTVTDGSANHDGKLSFTTAESSTSSFHCVIVNSGTFVLDAGTIEATSSTVSIGAVQVVGGTFTMNENGAVHVNYTGNVNGKNSRLVHANGGTTTINGGSIRLESKKDAIGVVYSSGNVTFNGGLFNISALGTAAVTNQAGAKNYLNIRGGYYSANTTTYFQPHVKTPYHIFSNSDETYIYRVAEAYTLTWDLDGGNVSVEGTPAGYVAVGEPITAPTVTKTGYTFTGWSTEVAQTMPANDVTYTATWAVASVTINGTKTNYRTIDAAFTAANNATAASTITLLDDVTVGAMLTYNNSNNKNCTLDLNGHTLSSTTAQALLYINKAGITFTITDLTESKSGTLHLESTSTDNRWCVYVANGNLQMDAGTVLLRSKANTYNEGIRIDPAASTFTMNGGKVHVVTSNGKPACGIVSRGKAFINGGEIQVETSGTGYGIEARVSDDGKNIGNVTVNGGKFLVTGTTAACAYRSDNKATLKLQGGYYNTNAGLSTYCAANYHVLPLTGEDPYEYEVAEAYTVTFNANGHGTAPVGQTVKNGEKATAPTAPTAIGYTFGGWYKEEACTNQWNFASDAVTTATTLYAKWTPNNVTITWVDGNGVSHVATATYGTIPTAPDEAKVKDPTEDYTYEFSGWDKEVAIATVPTTYTAQFNTAERFYGEKYRLDIADWSGNTASGTVTLNMSGYTLPRAKTNWKVVFGGSEYTKDDWNPATRLLNISGANLSTAGSDLTIKVYDYKVGSTSEYKCVSRQHYQVPIVVNSSAALSTLSPAATSDVRVRDGATLTVSSNATLRTVLVDAGSALKIESGKTLTVTDRLVLRTRTTKDIDFRAPELINNGTLTLDGAKMYYSRVVSDNSELYPIGFPFAVDLSKVIFTNSNMLTAKRGTNFALQYYRADWRAQYGMGGNWMLYEGDNMEASKGYLLLSTSKYYREFLFPVSYKKPAANATVAVEAHASQTGNPSDEGWNMIVAPFTASSSTKSGEPSETIKIAKLYEDNVNYYQDVATNLEPAVPFYYQHAGKEDGELSFKETPNKILRRSPRLNYTDRSVEEEWVRLSYGKTSQDGRRDVANIFAHPDRFSEEYESGADVVKMSTTGDRALLYSSLACGELAFAAVPDSLMEQGLPLTVNSPSEGEYRFELEPTDNLNRLESLYLYDDTYGSMIDLLESDYTTDVAAGVSRGRFRLFGVYRAPQIATDIEVVNGGNGGNGDADANGGNGENGAKPRKIMRDGYIYILMPNGDVYSVIGKRVEML